MSWQQQPHNPGYGQPWGSQGPPSGYRPPYNPASGPPPNAPSHGYSNPPPGIPGYGPTSSYHPPSYGGPPNRAPGPPSYGAPQTSSYGAPQTSSYGAPQTSSYGAPQTNYGAPSSAGSYGGQQSGGSVVGASPQDQELMSWFQAVDKDRSGKITALELREALVNSNWTHFNAETCRLLIGMFDRNKDGTIEFYEFAALWKYVQDWKSCFNKFDKDSSGNIDSGELQQALLSFGYRVSMDFCLLCTRVFDRSDKHTMKFDDFIQCCVMLRSLTESFKNLDTDRSGVINVNYEQFLEMAIDNSLR